MGRVVQTLLTIGLLLATMICSAEGIQSLTADAGLQGGQQWSRSDWNATSGKDGAAQFEIVADKDGALLRIVAPVPNDARFVYVVTVEPGTVYRFSCRARGENIGTDARGAGISVVNILEGSPDIKGSSPEWQSLEFYGKTGPNQHDLSVSVGIGGYGSLNSGTAWFRDVRVEKVAPPPANIRIAELQPPSPPPPSAPAGPYRIGGLISIALGLLGLLMAIWGFVLRRRGRYPGKGPVTTAALAAPPHEKVERCDLMLMAALSAVCLMVSLFNLGGHLAPETGWQATQPGETVTIELGREADLSRIYYYCGINARSGDGSRFTLAARNPGGGFTALTSFTKNDTNIWRYIEVNVRTSAVRLTADTPGGRLNEIALVEKGNQTPVIGLRIAENNIFGHDRGRTENLIDEQRAFEYAPSFRTGFYFDEIYHGRTAWETLHGIEPYETTHPPLGKLLISSGIALFGMNPFGWRIIGTLFGVALVPLMYLFGLKLFRDRFYAFCAAFLMLVEFMRFAQSRVAVIDVYAVFFIIVMYYFILDLFPRPGEAPRRNVDLTLLLAGTAFGIGAACKWIALYAGCGLALLVILRTFSDLRQQPFATLSGMAGFLLRRIGICLVAFGVIPALIYLLAYLPFLALSGPGHGLMDVFRLQAHMLHYHQTLQATHPFSSPWWSWPLDLRPMWMYAGGDLPANTASTIASFGNPAIFWPGLAAVLAAAVLAVLRRDVAMGVVLTALLCQYLPWIGINRLAFIYHFFSTIPFLILCLVAGIREVELLCPRFRVVTWSYLGLAAGLFILFYPVLSGMEVPQSYVALLRWLPTWAF